MLFDAQHGGRRHGAGGCGHKRHVVTLNTRAFLLPSIYLFLFWPFATQPAVHFNNAAGVVVQLQHTGVVDGRHLNSARGQHGLGFEALPFQRRHWGEEVVLVPAVLCVWEGGEGGREKWWLFKTTATVAERQMSLARSRSFYTADRFTFIM